MARVARGGGNFGERSADKALQRKAEQAERDMIQAAYERAKGEIDEVKIKESDFLQCEAFPKGYSHTKLGEDKMYLQRKSKFDAAKDDYEDKFGPILEAILYEQMRLLSSSWLGDVEEAYKTADVDDNRNGVDFYMYYEAPDDEESILALGIDATHSTTSVRNKLEKIHDNVERGVLSRIEYFLRDEEPVGLRTDVPLVVASLEKDAIVELAQLWMDGNQDALDVHPVQKELLTQIYTQLDYYAVILEEVNPELAKVFAQQASIIANVRVDKVIAKIGDSSYTQQTQQIQNFFDDLKIEAERATISGGR